MKKQEKKMGLCFSKKEAASSPTISVPSSNPNPIPIQKKAEKAPPLPKAVEAAPPAVAAPAAAEKKPKQVFVIAHNSSAADAADGKEKKRLETPTKKVSREVEVRGVPAMVVEEFKPAAGIRTSSCTKEEVDAILIQCGRLSRSSSGKGPGESGAGHRRHSGSKRSYDFDNERKGEEEGEEWGERPASRPSPHRRTPRTPSRERSGSRERGSSGGGGGRRVSRSPGRRSEATSASSGAAASERSKQPAKMVAVPAREKGRGVSPGPAAAKTVRSASPRSRSPAMFNESASQHAPPPLNQPPSLSRSSSRKAEQSPYRRTPMAELDENTLRANHNTSNKIQKTREEDGIRKTNQPQAQKPGENGNQGSRANAARNCVREEAIAMENASSKFTEKSSLAVDGQIPKTITRTRSSRRSSRDLDHALGLNQETFLNPNSYVSSLLLEDIQSYNQQHPNAAFSLPACVSKACSILEAVADLNSTTSEGKSLTGDHSSNDGRHGWRGLAKEPFVESEVVAKDDLMEPSLHKYVTTVRDFSRDDVEPQESAGSNSVVGQPWASPWEPNSADSTDRYCTSRSNNGDEVEEEEIKLNSLSHQSRLPETRGTRRSRVVVTASGNSFGSGHTAPATPGKNRRELLQRSQLHRSGGGGKPAGSRTCSLPAAAAAAASL